MRLEGVITDVVADRSGFVAVGNGASGATSWLSPDGVAWEELDVPEAVVLEADEFRPALTAGMYQLVRLGDTLYSFGGNSFMDSFLGAGWRWTDGESWQVIESRSAFFGTSVRAVTASDDALLASGVAFGGPRGSWMTWRWTPTTSWVQTPLSSNSEQVVGVTSVAWGAGTFVAAGFSVPFDWEGPVVAPANAIWTSPDGMTWSSVPVPDQGATICALTANPAGGFAAVGRTGGHLVVWTSLDGASWEVATVEPRELSDHNDEARCEVVAFAEGLLALVADGPDSTLTWTSRDGGDWAAAEDLEVALQGAAAFGDQAVVVGGRGTLDEPEQVVLRGQSDN